MKPVIAMVALWVGLLVGCAPNRPYRTYPRELGAAHAKPPSEQIERAPDYSLGFVEFDDQGALWNPRQLDAVVGHLHDIATNEPVLLVVFVHGWKHNASEHDGNVETFRRTLSGLALAENKSSTNARPRKVMGVYVGWRGLSVKVPGLKEFSFWTRKNTAHEVGYGGVPEVFVRLENEILAANNLRDEHSAMISVGHSFGGAVLFSATAGILTDRILSHQAGYNATGLGDLVILINPAFEAAKMQPLADAVNRAQTNATNARPTLAIITSKGDRATKRYFPLGRYISTIGESYRSSAQRNADHTAVGHYTKLITHDLRLRATNKVAKAVQSTAAATNSLNSAESVEKSAAQVGVVRQQMQAERRTGRPEPLTFTETILQPRAHHTQLSPVMIIYADNKIVEGHNGIAQSVFLGFLREFILTLSEKPAE
ncbi:MAG TPA: hypothetical protein VM680_01685 [Verrucomicrobiae bacterium]|nr:hypothetical protein [Verrucomicrobiae bacterium]